MRTLTGALATAVTALLLLTAAPTRAGAVEPGLEAEYVAALNDVRAGRGLAPLRVDAELVGVARAWADTMAAANDIWHNPDLGSQVSAPWVVLGENVGTGYEVPVVMQAFVDSPGHHRNIVDERFDFVGVGVTWGSDGRMYTAHVFMDLGARSGGPPPPPPAPAAAPRPAAVAAPATAPAPAGIPAPPPAAAAPERVEALLAAVRALGAGGVA